MVRRTSPQKKQDELAFPVRVRFAVPPRGFGNRLNDLHGWLNEKVGSGNYAVHSAHTNFMQATDVHLRLTDDAHALILAFPDFQLADAADCVSYYSPYKREEDLDPLCNLYSMTSTQAAIRELAQVFDDLTGNLPPLPGIFPDYQAPVVWNGENGRTLSMMRWGMPKPAFALKGGKIDSGVTNIRNTKSPHWRRWLGKESRCVVPFTSFSEYATRDGKKVPVWFALDETRPLAFFAGVWTQWTSIRKKSEGETTNDLFGFLTTDANAEVGEIHPKAMPVILRTADEVSAWLESDTPEALEMQKPLPDGTLKIVAEGEKKDAA